jgi:flagellar hook-associated protein 1 FlgK
VENVASLTSTLDANTANITIPAGTITINDREVGEILGGTAVNGLAMTKAGNAATAINAAETGVEARLTTLVAGSTIASGLANGETVDFTLNDVAISYTNTTGADLSAVNTATALRDAVNTQLTAYNSTATNPVTIEAVVGTSANGGATNSIVLKNINSGDQSSIIIAGVNLADAAEVKLGLTNGAYTADATHNTGQITLFSTSSFTLKAGANDYTLAQLGLADASFTFDSQKNDGAITYGPLSENATVDTLLSGYDYFDELDTSGSFDLWIYNNDGTLATPKAVSISLAGAYKLEDIKNIINKTVAAATNSTWVTASISDNSLRLTPDGGHQFAFANDTSNFLQIAGLNTFFTGSNAASIGINSVISSDLNKLAAATVDQQGQVFRGDNTNALKITGIQHDEYISYTGGAKNTLNGFYNTLVGQVANTSRTISHSYDASVLINQQVSEMRDSVSGVSLDEEMANLIKYQHAYTAAARLITMSDEMLQTLLDSVR